MNTDMSKGKFIVIDGTDGSGKGTQTDLLIARLVNEGRQVEKADFPQYGKPSAYFVEKYLRGEYGTANEVGPYQGSVFYAMDRFDASFELRKWIAEEKIIVSNRYVSANMGHQTGKIDSREEQDAFLEWLDNLEYNIMGIPKPDINILLYMPPHMGQVLVDQKGERAYTQGQKRDIHEADLEHLKRASDAYMYVAQKYNWIIINCADGEKYRSREDVHQEIYEKVKHIL